MFFQSNGCENKLFSFYEVLFVLFVARLKDGSVNMEV